MKNPLSPPLRPCCYKLLPCHTFSAPPGFKTVQRGVFCSVCVIWELLWTVCSLHHQIWANISTWCLHLWGFFSVSNRFQIRLKIKACLYIFKALHAFERIWSGCTILIVSLRKVFHNSVSHWVMLLWALISEGPGLWLWETWLMALEPPPGSPGFSSDKNDPEEVWFLGLTNKKTSLREDGSWEIIKLPWAWKHRPCRASFFFQFSWLYGVVLPLIYQSASPREALVSKHELSL